MPRQAEGRIVDGRYRLVRLIGEGGMATVWEAEHQTLGSPVAIKFLRPGMARSEELRERFLREARLAASVRHRNVVQIDDFGIDEDATPYIVMERLEGETLAELFERDERLEPLEAVRLVALALRGLSVVHERGVIHRDLKPENIFVVRDADGTYPKLLDFGVCRGARGSAERSITQEGTILGTPEYMPPEQARGSKDIDLRTDLYAMGVILYEALTGRLPFESQHIGDLLVKVACDPPTPITTYHPALPTELVALVHRAIAKDRSDRFESAREMRDALLGAMHDEWLTYESGVVTAPNAQAFVAGDDGPQASRAMADTVAYSEAPPARAGGGGWRWVLFLLAVAGAAAATLFYP